MPLPATRVFCARAPRADYGPCPDVRCPELPPGTPVTTALVALRSLLAQSGLDRSRFGRDDWNPLAGVIGEGARVVIKPNWVRHYNGSGRGMDCLVTHTTVIEAVLQYVALARPGRIVVGDAPVQGCDFDRLITERGVRDMIGRFTARGVPVWLKDFRRTILHQGALGTRRREDCRPMEDFVLYDLGGDSCLEEITRPGTEFRVTLYDPDIMKRTHGRGRHQYLVARDVIDADVVISVPKLKTHKKAGLTGALKNLVGINGHKEYLPHHRKGGSVDGGDCYPGRSTIKRIVEDLLDAANRAQGRLAGDVLARVARAGMVLGRLLGEDDNYEGAWRGNDTVWRMSLDLQRVLCYGRADGQLADHPQRTVLTVTDAIVAGEGDGPLSPTPVEFGMMTLGSSTAAVEWVHALLMGLDPGAIPLTREAFAPGPHPIATFPPSSIEVLVDGATVRLDDLYPRHGRRFRPPRGWQAGDDRVSPGWTASLKAS